MLRLTIAVLVTLATTARADEWVTPTPRTLTSPNGRVQAVVTPAADGKSGAQVTVGGATYTLADRWMPVDTLVFDDGTLLALDAWHALGYGKVATLYEHDGKIRWAKTLAELLGKSFVDRAPHSVSSIWWRKMPVEWTLAKDGKSGSITLFDENQLQLTLRDGSAKLVAVANLDDPARLLNRARALVEGGKEAEAVPLLERILDKDANVLEAASLYLGALQRSNEHARAVVLLDRISPRWPTPPKDAYGFANVCVPWARSLVAVSRHADAERVLRQAAAAAPTYTNPTIALAKLLLDQGSQRRVKEADGVLDDFVTRAVAAPSVDTYGVAEVADFYKTRGEPAKALAHYLKAYRKDRVTNQFLYANLAQLYEQMGKTADAIRIHEQLLAYFDTMGPAFASYSAGEHRELDRLRAKRP